MGIEAVEQVREGLAELIRVVNDGATPVSDLKIVLGQCKSFGGQLAVLQTDAAAGVAKRDRHGDSGVGVLAQAVGLTRRDAANQVKTLDKLQQMSTVRDALTSGEISVANAKTLAAACDKTSAEQVEQDSALLARAAVLSPEQFSREAGRWAVNRQDDGGEGEYRRKRARRRLSLWDGDDGMVHLRGELDPVVGAKVRKRFIEQAERLRRLDLGSRGGDKRSLDQRMADALDALTSHGSVYSDAEGVSGSGHSSYSGTETGGGGHDVETARGGGCDCGRRPSADITIVQHLNADGTGAFAEVAGGGVIPQSVLEEHFCNAGINGVVFSHKGVPLWHGHTKRLATVAQMRALKARYGACAGCGAGFVVCQGHHIEPVSQGGATDIDNLVPLCWACHQRVHHHNWRVVPNKHGLHTIAPPERIHYGPAHGPDPPPAHEPPRSRWGSGRSVDRQEVLVGL